jgi:hypothetical protein
MQTTVEFTNLVAPLQLQVNPLVQAVGGTLIAAVPQSRRCFVCQGITLERISIEIG